MNKIIIMLFYYERPNMVRNALRSIVKANEHYKNWHLVAFDDGSNAHLFPIVEEEFKGLGFEDRYVIIRNDITAEEKVNEGGMLGLRQNQIMEAAIAQLQADAFVILCDDDALHPEYLKNLNDYFVANPTVLSCYSKVILFNPLAETPDKIKSDFKNSPLTKLNNPIGPINGCRRVDASQVAWRACCYDMGARFPYPTPKDQDAGLFHSLYTHCGPMYPTGFVSQYKGVHPKQLGEVGAFKAWTVRDIDK
jgi:glycosyltransferase involved in cell wall biosynthesis